MGDKLLIRAYNVGCGDCIYVRIPNEDDGYHILIDCGTKGSEDLLRVALDRLLPELPQADNGKRRLDLIVATHRHEDHIKGFIPDWFEENIVAKHIWLSAVMDPDHPQAVKVNELHQFAFRAVKQLREEGRALGPEFEMLSSLYGVDNEEADELLMIQLPDACGITPKFVHAGRSSEDLECDLGEDTIIHVLAPERDIDHFYLGKEADESLHLMHSLQESFAARSAAVADRAPANISTADFRQLQARMLSSSLAFIENDTNIQNNMSVVLLIEWKGRRLLFVGDAEWHSEFKVGRKNGSWNVMWQERHEMLKAPIDFLKIGHHGSINATPPPPGQGPNSANPPALSVNQIFDALLPKPGEGEESTAQAIVSTHRSNYPTIPEGKVLVELGKRVAVASTRIYRDALEHAGIDEKTDIWRTASALANELYKNYEKKFLGEPQPLRTDLEHVLNPDQGYVEVEIAPKE